MFSQIKELGDNFTHYQLPYIYISITLIVYLIDQLFVLPCRVSGVTALYLYRKKPKPTIKAYHHKLATMAKKRSANDAINETLVRQTLKGITDKTYKAAFGKSTSTSTPPPLTPLSHNRGRSDHQHNKRRIHWRKFSFHLHHLQISVISQTQVIQTLCPRTSASPSHEWNEPSTNWY